MKILVVEDDFVSRKYLQKVLAQYGDVDVAVDGEEAMTAFKEVFGTPEAYQLITLDIMMPKMDGHQVLANIRAFEGQHGIAVGDPAKSVHVVMTSALTDSKNFMQSLRAGFEGYVPKPIDRERLISTLREIGLVD